MTDLAERLLRLEADPDFMAIESQFRRTNAFRILGTTDTERWHSAFWTWVLDPRASHGLGDFALRRLLVLLSQQGNLRVERLKAKASDDPDDPVEWEKDGDRHIPVHELMDLNLTTSLCAPGEDSCFREILLSSFGGSRNDEARFDALFALRFDRNSGDSSDGQMLVVLVLEFKVNAPYSPEQLIRYSQWLHQNPSSNALSHTNGTFVDQLNEIYRSHLESNPQAPLNSVGGFISKAQPKKDHKSKVAPEMLPIPWIAITYSRLIQEVLEPSEQQPNLDIHSKHLMRSYIDMTSQPDSDILDKTSQAQQQLVIAFMERHRETFEITKGVMAEDGDEIGADGIGRGLQTAESGQKPSVKGLDPSILIEKGLLKIGDQLIHGPSNESGIPDDLIAEMVDGGKHCLRYVSGGEKEIEDEIYTPTGLLRRIYRAHDSKFHDSGNRRWKVYTGKSQGKSLADLYAEARQLMELRKGKTES